MDEMERLRGDFALDRAGDDLRQIAGMLGRIQDKLKIMEAALSQVAAGESVEEEIDETSYGYIPLDLTEFFDCIFDLETALSADPDYADSDLRHRRVDFIEAGCGPGRNLFLLGATDRFEFRRVAGFDHSPDLIARGRQVFGLGERVFVDDCNTYDFSDWDVIYFYRPFSDADAQTGFEDRLVKQMKTGAYVIGCGHVGLSDDRRLLSKCDQSRIFKKLR